MNYLKLISVLFGIGMFSSAALSQEAKKYVDPSSKWLSAAGLVHSGGVKARITNAPTRQEAIENAKEVCLYDPSGECKVLGAWNVGCIYAVVGNTPSGAAAYGFGPSAHAAVNACENTGADCREDSDMINFCLQPEAQTTGEEVPEMSMAPLPQPEGNASKAFTGIYLPAEDTGSYVVNRKHTELTLCPDHDKANRCFVFINGNSSGLVSTEQIYDAYFNVPGLLASDRSLDLDFALLSQLRAGTSRVRYHLMDLAKGTTDGHYEGLLCLAYESERRKPSPEWQWCGYAAEVRSRRTGG